MGCGTQTPGSNAFVSQAAFIPNGGSKYNFAPNTNFYGTVDPTWCPMQPNCLKTFTFPWFPTVSSPDQGNWMPGTFVPPQPGLTMFRLPAMTIASRNCTPSPFVNATVYPANALRNRYASWTSAVNLPTQCGDDMTQSIVSTIGSGYYTADLGAGATAILSLGTDNNTVTCTYTLGTQPPAGLTVLNVSIIVTDGPVYASDDPLYTGNPSSPTWQFASLNVSSTGVSSINLSQALNSSVARSYTRVVDCLVEGVNTFTTFPFTITAGQPFVVETYGQGWQPYEYPMPGNYTPSSPPTPSPSSSPTEVPTPSPSSSPSASPSGSPSASPSASPSSSPTQTFSLGTDASTFLTLEADNNTVACYYTWGGGESGTQPSPGFVALNVSITVTDGPVYASDDPLYTGNPSSPTWQSASLNVYTFANSSSDGFVYYETSSIELNQALNSSVARNYTRVVDCLVEGVNTFTTIPFTLSGQSFVVETYGQGWQPYEYPMPGNYTPSYDPSADDQ